MYRRSGNRKKRGISLKGYMILAVLAVVIGIAVFRFTAQPAIADSRSEAPRYKYYTSICVAPGDSLWSIAEEHMSSDYETVYDYISEVQEINHLSGDYLRAGTKLCVPYYSDEYK